MPSSSSFKKLSAVAFTLLLEGAAALHPRPDQADKASFARWLVHESDYAVVSTLDKSGHPFGNIVSISDGHGTEHSTGVIYTYIPTLDETYEELQRDKRVSLTFTEMALIGGQSGGCRNSTAENPPCGRVTIQGKLTQVPEARQALALRYLFARHPEMEGWSGVHKFIPYWMAPANIESFFIINFYGGPSHPTPMEYFIAPWYKQDNSSESGRPGSGVATAHEAEKELFRHALI